MLRLSNFGGRSHDLKGASSRKKRARVTVQKIAPMGDPMEIRLRSYELTLRMDDAAQIEILPEVGA